MLFHDISGLLVDLCSDTWTYLDYVVPNLHSRALTKFGGYTMDNTPCTSNWLCHGDNYHQLPTGGYPPDSHHKTRNPWKLPEILGKPPGFDNFVFIRTAVAALRWECQARNTKKTSTRKPSRDTDGHRWTQSCEHPNELVSVIVGWACSHLKVGDCF